jgi:hypothetical protein
MYLLELKVSFTSSNNLFFDQLILLQLSFYVHKSWPAKTDSSNRPQPASAPQRVPAPAKGPMMTPPTIHVPMTLPNEGVGTAAKRSKAYKASLASSLSNMMAQLDR